MPSDNLKAVSKGNGDPFHNNDKVMHTKVKDTPQIELPHSLTVHHLA